MEKVVKKSHHNGKVYYVNQYSLPIVKMETLGQIFTIYDGYVSISSILIFSNWRKNFFSLQHFVVPLLIFTAPCRFPSFICQVANILAEITATARLITRAFKVCCSLIWWRVFNTLNATGVTGDRRAQIDRNIYNKEMTILMIFYYYHRWWSGVKKWMQYKTSDITSLYVSHNRKFIVGPRTIPVKLVWHSTC